MTTDSPARTPAVLRTAPTPVVAAQPMSAATSWGVRGSTGDRGGSVHDLVGRVRARAVVHAQRPAVGRCARTCSGARRWPRSRGIRHSHTSPRRAWRACAAGRGPREHHEVADARTRHPLAHGTHDARALVTQDDVGRACPLTVHHVQVRMADTRADHGHQDLAGPGRIERERLDGQRPAGSHEHGARGLRWSRRQVSGATRCAV